MSGRFGGRASEKAGARDMAMDTGIYYVSYKNKKTGQVKRIRVPSESEAHAASRALGYLPKENREDWEHLKTEQP
jgi:hypothetical protein